ncbi:MAG: hypothetical protein KGP29_01315 [Proteobacteria bacterium]|nr:hypothetical protein [Pseudomonadota bacterium]
MTRASNSRIKPTPRYYPEEDYSEKSEEDEVRKNNMKLGASLNAKIEAWEITEELIEDLHKAREEKVVSLIIGTNSFEESPQNSPRPTIVSQVCNLFSCCKKTPRNEEIDVSFPEDTPLGELGLDERRQGASSEGSKSKTLAGRFCDLISQRKTGGKVFPTV